MSDAAEATRIDKRDPLHLRSLLCSWGGKHTLETAKSSAKGQAHACPARCHVLGGKGWVGSPGCFPEGTEASEDYEDVCVTAYISCTSCTLKKRFKKSYLISSLQWTYICLLPLPFSGLCFQVLYLDSMKHFFVHLFFIYFNF